jgi:hypothetical protein
MLSSFRKSLKKPFSYQVEVDIHISDGTRAKLVKYVRAWNKARARKQALAMCLKDIKLDTGNISRIKGTTTR